MNRITLTPNHLALCSRSCTLLSPGCQKVIHLKCKYKCRFYRFNSMIMATGSGFQSWAPLLGSRRVILGDIIVTLSSGTLESISWINFTIRKNVTAEVSLMAMDFLFLTYYLSSSGIKALTKLRILCYNMILTIF